LVGFGFQKKGWGGHFIDGGTKLIRRVLTDA